MGLVGNTIGYWINSHAALWNFKNFLESCTPETCLNGSEKARAKKRKKKWRKMKHETRKTGKENGNCPSTNFGLKVALSSATVAATIASCIHCITTIRNNKRRHLVTSNCSINISKRVHPPLSFSFFCSFLLPFKTFFSHYFSIFNRDMRSTGVCKFLHQK